jgi:predicted nucleic acid-binding protein
LDSWTSTFADPISVAPSDIKTATSWVRRTDFALRAPDAIHVAAARRLDLVLVTLDSGMANAARMLGVACINPAESSA